MTISETNAIPDIEIDLSEIPEITSLDGFKPIHPEYYKPVETQYIACFQNLYVQRLTDA